MRELPKETPIFFKTRPRTETTPPDAIYLRPEGALPGGKAVHKIRWRQDTWLVGDGDFKTHQEALAEAAKAYQAEIDRAKEPGMKPEEIAKALQISPGTLRKRLGFIRNHLAKL